MFQNIVFIILDDLSLPSSESIMVNSFIQRMARVMNLTFTELIRQH